MITVGKNKQVNRSEITDKFQNVFEGIGLTRNKKKMTVTYMIQNLKTEQNKF